MFDPDTHQRLDFEGSQDILLPGTASKHAEEMAIFITSQSENSPEKNFYKVVIHTGYSGRNASDTDEIMDGYNYTQVLDQVKAFEAGNNPENLDLHQFLQKNLPGNDNAWADVVSARQLSEADFRDGFSISTPGIKEGIENDLNLLVSIDSAYGYFGFEHLEKQPITFRVNFKPHKELGIKERQELNRLTSKLLDEAFGYGINGRNQFDAYLAEASSELERSPDADEHIKQSGIDAPRTIEYMNNKLHGLLTRGDVTFIGEVARAERAKNLVTQIQNVTEAEHIGEIFGDPQISGQKNPLYLEHTADTMNVIVSMIPNRTERAIVQTNRNT